MGASSAGLWLSGSGRIYSLSRSGGLLAVAVGTVVDASLSDVLYDDCAIAGPCTLRAAGPTATQARIGPSAEIRIPVTNDRSDSALSPDGRWLLLEDGLLDRRTGARVAHSFVLRSWRWSPDGRWLFVFPANSDSVAVNLADGRNVHLGHIGVLAGVVTR